MTCQVLLSHSLVLILVLPMGSSVDVLTTLNETDETEGAETPMYEKYDHLLHGGSRSKR